jgi:hypothetical protein
MSRVKKKVQRALDTGKLEKAYIVIYKKTGSTYKVTGKIQVQFNPAEYSIQRGVNYSKKRPLGRDASSVDTQAVSAEHSVLSVMLYFDSYTELKSGQGLVNPIKNTAANYLKKGYNYEVSNYKNIMPSFDMNEDLSPAPDYTVNRRFEEFMELIKYAPEEHEPPHVGFIWGDSLFFVGKVTRQTVQYTVFDRDGTPVRAKLNMSIIGEEVAFDSKEYPFESPDRTKQRTLQYGDQLWMMAQEEYGDAAHWKTIARANDILNPRAMGGAVRLKVPSIR